MVDMLESLSGDSRYFSPVIIGRPSQHSQFVLSQVFYQWTMLQSQRIPILKKRESVYQKDFQFKREKGVSSSYGGSICLVRQITKRVLSYCHLKQLFLPLLRTTLQEGILTRYLETEITSSNRVCLFSQFPTLDVTFNRKKISFGVLSNLSVVKFLVLFHQDEGHTDLFEDSRMN